MSENNDCCICHEDMSDNLFTTSCNHTFHAACIRAWCSNSISFSCPICRIRIPLPKQAIACSMCGCDDFTKMARYSDIALGPICSETGISNLITGFNRHYCTQCIDKQGQQTCPDIAVRSIFRRSNTITKKYICFKSLVDPTKYYFFKNHSLDTYNKRSTLCDFKRLKLTHCADHKDFIKSKMYYIQHVVFAAKLNLLTEKRREIEKKFDVLNEHHALINELNV